MLCFTPLLRLKGGYLEPKWLRTKCVDCVFMYMSRAKFPNIFAVLLASAFAKSRPACPTPGRYDPYFDEHWPDVHSTSTGRFYDSSPWNGGKRYISACPFAGCVR